MKNIIKAFAFLFVCTLMTVACDKDDDVAVKKLSTVTYSPNKVEVLKDKAVSSATPKIDPKEAKVTFAIKSVTKDAKKFTNPSTGFKVSETGVISLAKDNKLDKATYVLTIEATDKADKKVKKTANYTVKVK
ncbi:cadherin repeat domain-containing protein [Puteibacter caeruleilacunae]|nr:cadherin repeat domain-containing protein [Puteibacter caeruleilacunae]